MIKRINHAIWLTGMALLLGLITLPVMAKEEQEIQFRQETVNDHEEEAYGWVYRCESCNLYGNQNENSAVMAVLPSGYQVQILSSNSDVNGDYWFYVSVLSNGIESKGYIRAEYVISPDSRYASVGSSSYGLEEYSDDVTAGFPVSYGPYLRELHSKHPNWVFVPQYTGLDWTASVNAEMTPQRNLVASTKPDIWKSQAAGDYDPATGKYVGKSGDGWNQASRNAVEYTMDPRNYLSEDYIFAFEQLTYQSDIHNQEGVNAILSGTWMYGRMLEDGSGGLYRDVFMDAGRINGVSPYHLAARVRQEQGAGTSALISGTYPGYAGYYNYYNIGANGKTTTVIILNGLNYAKKNNWNCRATALINGAYFIAKNYISIGQDTLYLEKFDVDNSDGKLYNHQYMQNIEAALSEGKSVKKAYQNYGVMENRFIFRIPVFNNMPSSACTVDGSSNNLYIEAFVRNLYQVILNREPDETGLVSWCTLIRNGFYAADIVDGFVFSPEFTEKNLSDEEFIGFLYQAVLMRDADPVGMEGWKSELAQGASRKWVLASFLYSDEFRSNCSSYGITAGTLTMDQPIDSRPALAKFVTRLYRNVMKREPDQEGVAYWTKQLADGATAAELLECFLYSEEFLSKDSDTLTYLTILYTTVLNREPDEGGIAYWSGVMEQEGDMRRQVAAKFCLSAEFAGLCAEYGITPGVMRP